MPAWGLQGLGVFGMPKRGSMSPWDGLDQALNTPRNVFKAQKILQARGEDLTAVPFQHGQENMSHEFSPHLTCTCGSKRIYGKLGIKQLGELFQYFLFLEPSLLQLLLPLLSRVCNPREHCAASSRAVVFSQISVADRENTEP